MLISNWDELNKLESDNYIIVVESNGCCGWVYRKSDNYPEVYLSTHTFYDKTYNYTTMLLKMFGFDVQLKNWDGETEIIEDYQDQWKYYGFCDICRRKSYCSKKCKKASEC